MTPDEVAELIRAGLPDAQIIVESEDNRHFAARVIDAAGNERTYLRDEVVSMRREMRSFMPGDYARIFSDAELDDLVAYIVRLRSEANRQ